MLALSAIFTWADNEEYMGFDFVYDSNGDRIGVKVRDGSPATGSVITIPETHWGLPVIEIGENAFWARTDIQKVVLPTSIVKVGKSAFEGCGQLTTVDFGQSLVTVDERAFALCQNLSSVTLPNTTKEIGEKAFWNCTNLKKVILGNSLRSIGGYAFQYCKEMTSISLPNSLTSVGDHFLCACHKLTSLVIPENLTSIGEYFLHGCESMRTVYLMGDKQRTLGNYPFVTQDQERMDQVRNCVFYVESEHVYENFYKNADNWKYADANNSEPYGDDGHYQNGGNRYEWEKLPDDIIPYEVQWMTACYPTDVDAGAVFGDKALVAKMTKANYKGKNAKGEHLYHLEFDLVEDKKMLAHTPYLLKADAQNDGSAFIVEHTEEESMKVDEDLSHSVQISNQSEDPSASQTLLKMLGTYTPTGRNLEPGEFIFSNQDGILKFYKQANGGKQRHLRTYRCYWQIIKDNQKVTDGKLGMFESGTTGICAEVYVHHKDKVEIFNMRGQPVKSNDDSLDGFPAGMYIVNGKKVMVR